MIGDCSRESPIRPYGVEVGAAAHVAVHKVLRGTFLAEILDWIRPQYVAHEARCRRLAEPIELQGVMRPRSE